MEQHEIAIRDEVAKELGVIMGDMASEIKVRRALFELNLHMLLIEIETYIMLGSHETSCLI